MIEADEDRQKARGAQTRDECGLEQGALAQARLPKQDGEWFVEDALVEVVQLLAAPEEERLRLLGEGTQAQPRRFRA